MNTITEFNFLAEDDFKRRLLIEQKRTERSRRSFVFVLLEAPTLFRRKQSPELSEQVARLLSTSIRETDVVGWYESARSVGLIFTEIGGADGRVIGNALVRKTKSVLGSELSAHQVNQIQFSFCVFPDDWAAERGSSAEALHPDSTQPRRLSRMAKRSIDIAGSVTALTLTAPVFLVIALAIKLTSKGPVLFRQQRVGQRGRKFTFLKFRSMKVNNDHGAHKAFVEKHINGSVEAGSVYKMTNDPRITSIGKLLRKTSLDELPQFLNVLAGDMSLVGPRPPIPYEVDAYDIWHRRRLVLVKPGITGLWQINGRSRTTFDEMVRLDLQYARTWSIWLDLRILIRTPRAVVAGDGAY